MQVLQTLLMAFNEVRQFGHVSVDLAKVFAKMDIDHVELLLKYPEDLRSTLQGVAKDIQQEESGLPDFEFMSDFEMMPLLED